MGKRRIPKETDCFHYFNNNPKGKTNAGDCAVRAISAALAQPWDTTLDELVQMSHKTKYSPFVTQNINKYLESKGWVKCSQPRKADDTKYTGREFCKNHLECIKNDKIIISIGCLHLSVIINSKVYDTWDCTDRCIGNYWVRKE